ncbi:nuclease [Rhizobium sp. G187]|uniref:nuclease n=1 Tax=Rhizobium sp. G187 TaxID=3451352 RepID=UPI003EE574E5
MASTSNRRTPRKRRKSTRSSASRSGQGLTSWLVVLGLVAAGIGVYENRAAVMKEVGPYLSRDRRETKTETPRGERQAALPTRADKDLPIGVVRAPVPPKAVAKALDSPVPVSRPSVSVASTATATATGLHGPFYFCGTSGLDKCVASGDSFWVNKKKVVLADVIAPATENAACAQERQKGFAAKVRLRALLNAGEFDLQLLKGQGTEGSSDAMRVATRNGRSLGSILVSEGLARPRMARGHAWCS